MARDKARIRIGGDHHRARVGRLTPQCAPSSSMPTAIPASPTLRSRCVRQRADFRRPLAGILPARLGGGARTGDRRHRERARDCPFLPTDCRALHAARAAADNRSPVRSAIGDIRRWPLAGGAAMICARRWSGRAAQDRDLDARTASPSRNAGHTGRSILQRQHAEDVAAPSVLAINAV